jgi:hypothetical protein
LRVACILLQATLARTSEKRGVRVDKPLSVMHKTLLLVFRHRLLQNNHLRDPSYVPNTVKLGRKRGGGYLAAY